MIVKTIFSLSKQNSSRLPIPVSAVKKECAVVVGVSRVEMG